MKKRESEIANFQERIQTNIQNYGIEAKYPYAFGIVEAILLGNDSLVKKIKRLEDLVKAVHS